MLGEGFARRGVAVGASADGSCGQVDGDEAGAGVADAAVLRPGVVYFGGICFARAVSFEVPVLLAIEALDFVESHFSGFHARAPVTVAVKASSFISAGDRCLHPSVTTGVLWVG